MSSPRSSGLRTPDRSAGSRTPSRNTPRRSNRTPSSSVSSSRRRLAGTSERDVIPPSDVSTTPRRSQAPSSPFHAGISEIDLSSPINYGTPSSIGSMRSTRSGIGGTPIRMRPDIGTDRRARVVNLVNDQPVGNADVPSQHSETDATPNLVIWGTNVVVSKCKQKFKRFIQEFIDEAAAEDEISEGIDLTLPLYLQKLQEVAILENPFLNLNCNHLEEFDAEFYQQLIHYPQEVIPTLDMAANELFFEKYPAAVLEHQIQVRPFNSRKTKSMRELNPEDVDHLITMNGMVIRVSNLIPEIREAFFKCIVCSYVTAVTIEKGHIAEPTLCPSCSTNHCFQLIHNRSQFTDKQIVKLQESPDDIPAGQTPHTVTLLCYNDMVDSVQAGERVTVTGIYRAVPIQVHPRMSNVLSVYRTFVDCVHFRKLDASRLHVTEEGKQHNFPPERVDMLRALSTKDDVYERLASALAPSIYGNLDVKKGILLQLFGGRRKSSEKTGRGKMRSEINILLCGDPGTSKSQLLSYVYDLVPRSQYTSGKGSSAVGLTAYVMKDPETRQLVLQTGALVLADNGICCIDEFDKMNDSTRSVLHEVMEQQTLSIAKAGIICQLNARTSILAAANPCESQWNMKKTIIENILLPHSLLSRFDLIFLMLDPQSEAYDKRLAHHLVSLYHKQRERDEQDHMDMDVMKDYIAYAREHINPLVTEDAALELKEAYVKMREIGSRRGQITAYPRQLESLIRLAEAHARMRFSDKVEVRDVREAQRLYTEALKQSATDPITGTVDVTIIGTGQSESHRNEMKAVSGLLKSMLQKKEKGTVISYQQLYNDLKEAHQKAVEYSVFDQCLKTLEDSRLIMVTPRTSVKVR